MLSMENISKSFGSNVIFDCVNFRINPKERIGLVGRNGCGKTTLLRIIMGQENLEQGSVTIPKNYRIGYVKQDTYFSKVNILEEGIESLIESEKDHHWKVKKILSGLGFSKTDMGKHPKEFSGGKQIKLNLAKALISEPNLLLLDEPTNYLDIVSINWIKNFFLTWSNELILITHDRSFMDKIATHTAGIYRNKIKKMKGDTTKFYDYLVQDEEDYEKMRTSYKKKEKKMLSFIERFRAKAKLARMVQSRIRTMAKTKKVHKLEKLKVLDFSFKSKPFRSQNVLSVKDLSFAYPKSKTLFSNLSFSVKANNRICIIGKNGRGKTTLLKIIAKKLQPVTGSVIYNPQVTEGIFEQNSINSLSKSRTVEEEILRTNTDVNKHQARKICGAMMFEGDNALKKIDVLSGGEKNRVVLGKLSAIPLNLLILDEPTNHLDMDSCDALLTAIDNFKGAVIMVTHNEMLLHTLAERLIVFDDDRTYLFEGCYQEFIDSGGWGNIEAKNVRKQTNCKSKLGKKALRRMRSNIITEKSKIIRPIKKEIDVAKAVVKKHQNKLDNLHQKLISASQVQNGDRTKIGYFSREAHNCEKIITKQLSELNKMERRLKDIEVNFQKRLLKIA